MSYLSNKNPKSMNFDVAIIGSGLAGLSVALHLAENKKIAVISKRTLRDGASDWAQGGIAAVLDSTDSIDQHVSDTLIAGAGICDEKATRFIVEHSRKAIEWLIKQGVPFTKDESTELGYHLTREGGHSQRRIIHAADATGHAVQLTLEQRVREHPNITLLEHHFAIDLITTDKLHHVIMKMLPVDGSRHIEIVLPVFIHVLLFLRLVVIVLRHERHFIRRKMIHKVA